MDDAREILLLLADGLTKAERVAEACGCTTEDARARLAALVSSGLVSGPVLTRWGDSGEWSEMGYGLLRKGREVIEA